MKEDTTDSHCGVDLFAGVSTASGHNPLARIHAVRENNTDGKCALTFATRSTSNISEAMRINSDGEIGIGTQTPTAKLHVSRLDQHETDSALTVMRGDTGSDERQTAPIFNVFNGQGGGTEVFRVQGDGKIGIGTDTPAYDVEVHGKGKDIVCTSDHTDGTRVTHALMGGDSDGNGVIGLYNDVGNNQIILSAKTGEPSFINSGNVGIGTENPQNMLNIGENDGAGYGLTVNSPTVYGANIITSGDNTNATTSGSLYVRHKNDDGTELDILKATSGGNVGIGTDTPLNLLHVQSMNSAVAGTPAGQLNGSHNTESFFRMTSGGMQDEVNSMSAELRLAQGPNGIDNLGNTHPASPEATIELAVNNGAHSNNDYGRTPSVVVTEIDSDGLRQVGTVSAGGNVLTSDNRIKHNEQTVENAIDIINQLTPKKYIKTVEMYDENHDFEIDEQGAPVDDQGLPVKHVVETGLIAQDLMQIQELNHVVRDEVKDKDGQVKHPMGVDYNSLFTYAVAAIKEQQVMIETMKQEIETLKNS